jgi:hypothetical protein
MPHVNLVIATPGKSFTASYVKSLLATAGLLIDSGITFTFANGYSSHVADAREITLSGTRENNIADSRPFEGNITYDKILWIDSDISWNPEDVLKIYESDKDIISGAYLLDGGAVAAYKEGYKAPFTYDEVKEMSELFPVHSVGFGFVCFKSGIFEKLSRPWFQSPTVTINVDGKDYSFAVIGEDISLCHRVNQLGYQIWLDPTIRLTHQRTVQAGWDGYTFG